MVRPRQVLCGPKHWTVPSQPPRTQVHKVNVPTRGPVEKKEQTSLRSHDRSAENCHQTSQPEAQRRSQLPQPLPGAWRGLKPGPSSLAAGSRPPGKPPQLWPPSLQETRTPRERTTSAPTCARTGSGAPRRPSSWRAGAEGPGRRRVDLREHGRTAPSTGSPLARLGRCPRRGTAPLAAEDPVPRSGRLLTERPLAPRPPAAAKVLGARGRPHSPGPS